MKTVRLSSVVLAIVLIAVAFSPVAAKPAAAPANISVASTSPAQHFLDAMRGLPLLAPLSAPASFMTIRVESAASTADYGCTLVSQSPKDYTKMVPRQYFDATWAVRNTGKRVWYSSMFPFQYIGGEKMQTRKDTFSLPTSKVGIGQKVSLTVDMEAPKAPGGYSTLWGIYSGKTAFCKVTLTIAVTK